MQATAYKRNSQLSEAIEGGLYHPNCKDTHSTYFEGLDDEPQKPTQKDADKAAETYNAEQKKRYARRQARKYERLEAGSVDGENVAKYEGKRQAWGKTYLELSEDKRYNKNKQSYHFSTGTDRPYEIRIPEKKKREIFLRSEREESPVFASDTLTNKFASCVKNVQKEEDFYDVALHGADTYVEFFGEPIDAYTLSQIIMRRTDYKKGTPVRILSCNVGNTENTGDCVAQLVANEMGVIVKAPTEVLYVFPDGRIEIGERNTGEMKLFYPRK